MSKNFVQSRMLRGALLRAYRLYARAQLWRTGPRVFVNSIPKAGTHLLTSELEKFGTLQNSRLHLEFLKISAPGELVKYGPPVYDVEKVARRIATVRPGQIFSAHLRWSEPLVDLMTQHDVRMIFMTRDPRDILVSALHYIIGLRRHRLHEYMTTHFTTDEERYRVLVEGHSVSPFVRSMKNTLESFLPWLDYPGVLPVKFENLVGERGGGSIEAKREALTQIATHCNIASDIADQIAKSPTTWTPTLRKGRANAWRDELPSATVARIADECSPLLEAFGYPIE